MKAKKVNRRLRLNKKTIANLKKVEMNGLYGAGECDSVTTTCFNCQFIESYCGGEETCPTLTGTPNSQPCCRTC